MYHRLFLQILQYFSGVALIEVTCLSAIHSRRQNNVKSAPIRQDERTTCDKPESPAMPAPMMTTCIRVFLPCGSFSHNLEFRRALL